MGSGFVVTIIWEGEDHISTVMVGHTDSTVWSGSIYIMVVARARRRFWGSRAASWINEQPGKTHKLLQGFEL